MRRARGVDAVIAAAAARRRHDAQSGKSDGIARRGHHGCVSASDRALLDAATPLAAATTSSSSTWTAASGSATSRRPGAVEAIDALRDGRQAASRSPPTTRAVPREDYVTRLWGIGVKASLRDVVTVGGAMQHLLAETRPGRTAFVIGSPAMLPPRGDAGLRVLNGTDLASRAEVVVVAGTQRPRLRRPPQRRAGGAPRRGPPGHRPRPHLPPARRPVARARARILAAVETASERTAEIVGKPEPQLFLTALDRLGEGTRRWWSATAWTPTSPPRPRRARRRARCSRAAVRGPTSTAWTRSRRGGGSTAHRAEPALEPARPADRRAEPPRTAGSTPTSAHASGSRQPGRARPRRARPPGLRPSPRAGVRRTPRPRSPVWRSPWTATAPALAQLAAQQRQQLLERLRAVRRMRRPARDANRGPAAS